MTPTSLLYRNHYAIKPTRIFTRRSDNVDIALSMRYSSVMNNPLVCAMCPNPAVVDSIYCSVACRQKAYRERKKGEVPQEAVDPIKERLDAMALFLQEEIGGLKASIANMENRLVEMSNKYGGISNFIYKATAEFKKKGDPEHKSVDYNN